MSGESSYEVRFLDREEWEDAMGLSWKTFLEFEGDVYSPEGIRNFEDFITDSGLKRLFLMGAYQVMAAYEGSKIIGIISLRNENHISLLFVDRNYHKRGIGRALVLAMAEYARAEMGQKKLTVNASPYGVEFYHRLGFTDTEPEKQQNGIIITPMELVI